MTKLAQEVVPREALAVLRPAGLAVVVLEPGHLLALLKGEQVVLQLQDEPGAGDRAGRPPPHAAPGLLHPDRTRGHAPVTASADPGRPEHPRVVLRRRPRARPVARDQAPRDLAADAKAVALLEARSHFSGQDGNVIELAQSHFHEAYRPRRRDLGGAGAVVGGRRASRAGLAASALVAAREQRGAEREAEDERLSMVHFRFRPCDLAWGLVGLSSMPATWVQ